MFDGLIVGGLARVIADSVKPENLTEIRLRAGRRLLLLTSSANGRVYPRIAGGDYVVSQEEIDSIIARATDLSPYSVSDEMIKGYIPSKKLRIGIAGEGVSDGGRLLNVKNVSYLVIRVPHQIKSAADGIIGSVYCCDGGTECGENAQMCREDGEVARGNGGKTVLNTLIVSPPGCGKTTVLRELARILSVHKNVVVIDERYELASVADGIPTLDVGDSDVVSGVPKAVAYENCIRAMNPDVIVTDELFRQTEVNAICDVLRSGVKVIASVHGNDLNSLAGSSDYAVLIEKFDLAVVLGRTPIGCVKDIIRL